MSKIGKKPLLIPSGVTVEIVGKKVSVKGSLGTLSIDVHPSVTVLMPTKEALAIKIEKESDKSMRALWGLTWRLIFNMIIGVKDGFKKQLEVRGIGYKVNVSGKTITLNIGFSHEVAVVVPDGLKVSAEKNILTIQGIDKGLVGSFAAKIRALRKPEPYKGKGIRYVGEEVRQKAGKAAKAAGAK